MRRIILSLCLTLFVGALMAGPGAETLEAFLRAHLMETFKLDANNVSISILRSDVPVDDVSSCEVKVYPLTASPPRGRYPMRVELYRDGVMIERGAVTLDIRMMADVPVPVRRIGRHEMLTPDMFELKRFDVTTITEPMLGDLDRIDGMRCKNSLIPGRYVSLSRIEKIPDVENGAPVAIIGSAGVLEIRARGTALQKGYIGESIKVKNNDSRKILVGTITAPGVVEISI